MSGNGKEPVKVVIINTQYVETDAGSFKSVVQKLTGKDAVVDNSLPDSQNNVSPQDSSFKEAKGLPVNVLERNWPAREFSQLLE